MVSSAYHLDGYPYVHIVYKNKIRRDSYGKIIEKLSFMDTETQKMVHAERPKNGKILLLIEPHDWKYLSNPTKGVIHAPQSILKEIDTADVFSVTAYTEVQAL